MIPLLHNTTLVAMCVWVNTGCWRDSTASYPLPVTRDESVKPIEPGQSDREDQVGNGDPDLVPLVNAVTSQIRNSQLPTIIANAIVVLDIDSGTFSVACGAVALQVATDTNVKFKDPLRGWPICEVFSRDKLRCSQTIVSDNNGTRRLNMFVAGFGDIKQPRFESLITGSNMVNYKLIKELPSRVAMARCP